MVKGILEPTLKTRMASGLAALMCAVLLSGCATRESPPAKPASQPGEEIEGFARLRKRAQVRKALPSSMRRTLERADEFELLSLDPELPESEGRSGELFRGHHVLGRVAVAEPGAREQILGAVYGSVSDPGFRLTCFRPRHAIRAVRGDRVVDVVVCFECLRGIAYEGEKQADFTLTHAGAARLTEFLSERGVEVRE